jgi:hypothetical protein
MFSQMDTSMRSTGDAPASRSASRGLIFAAVAAAISASSTSRRSAASPRSSKAAT